MKRWLRRRDWRVKDAGMGGPDSQDKEICPQLRAVFGWCLVRFLYEIPFNIPICLPLALCSGSQLIAHPSHPPFRSLAVVSGVLKTSSSSEDSTPCCWLSDGDLSKVGQQYDPLKAQARIR